MSENCNRSAVSSLEDISCKWNTDDVVALLKKNGLIECCAAIVKRRVDGKALLSVTEQNFNSWKNDLPISSFCLHRFAAELKNNPENYLLSRETGSTSSLALNSEALSDSDTWDTDFDDDEDTSITNSNCHQRLSEAGDNNSCLNERSEEEEEEEEKEVGKVKIVEEEKETKMQYWQIKSRLEEARAPPSTSGLKKPAAYLNRRQQEEKEEEEEEVITEEDEEESFYENGIKLNDGSNLASLLQKQLQLRERKNIKPTISSKPQLSEAKMNPKPPTNGNKSFLNTQVLAKTRTTINNQQQTKNQESRQSRVFMIKSELVKNKPLKKPEENPPAPPKPKVTQSSVTSNRNLPKPPSAPITIGKLDLLADLPKFDKNADSFLTRVNSARKTSSEGCYRPYSITTVEREEPEEPEDEDTTYEIVNEMPTHFKFQSDEDYLQPIRQSSVMKFRQPQTPINLPIITTEKERSPDKKIGIYPASGNQARVPRPLPPPPDSQKAERPADISTRKKDGQSYKEKAWFHNVSRDEAGALITAGATEFGSLRHNGYFLLRPSGNLVDQPLTLVLWYTNRPFNIPVRKRPDSRFALGSAKPDEQSFASVEEMVDFYKQKELVLYRSGVSVGSTRLTDTPPKRKDLQ